MDHHSVAAISITGSCLDVLGSLYLAYDLLGGRYGPLRLLTRAVTYFVVFGIGYALGLGLFFGLICQLAFPALDIQAEGIAVVGMAAFFTGVVRAPLTGIVLVTEMTASVVMLLPMLGACFIAMLVPALLRDAPIYDALRERLLAQRRAGEW